MEGFELSIVINRPIEEVFAVLANLENDVKWRREWVDARKTSGGPIGVGSTFRLVGQFLRWRSETEYEVIEYERNGVALEHAGKIVESLASVAGIPPSQSLLPAD
jgi:hypothetical protein